MRPESLLAQLEKTIAEAPAESVPALLGDLERLAKFTDVYEDSN